MRSRARSALTAAPLLLLPATAAAQMLPVAGVTSTAPLDQPALFTPDDLVLLEVFSGSMTLTDALGGYSSRAGTYLPLSELSRLLDLAVVVLPPERRATGWIISQERSFELDLGAGTARSGNVDLKLSATDAVLVGDEIYVRVDLLSRLIPAEFKADINALMLTITPREILPFKARIERERRARTVGGEAGDDFGTKIDVPYLAYTLPSLDVALDTAFSNRTPKSRYRYDVRLAGDLLWSGFQAYLGSDDGGKPQTARILFERKDPDGHVAGPFGITRSSIGDTFTPSLALGVGSEAGRGFAFTSEPIEQASVFNRVDLRGELPLGYQVELYVNEVLRGSQTQPVDGRYEFREVPLIYGLNVVRLVFYGPRGEQREEVQRLNVGGGQLAEGEFRFSLGAVEQGRPVLRLEDGTPATQLLDPGEGKLRAVGRAAFGFSERVTLTGGVATYAPIPGSERFLGTVGLRSGVAGLATQLDLASDDQGGAALALGLAGRPAGVSLVARHSEYRGGFIDEALPRGGAGSVPLRRSSDVRGDFSVTVGPRSLPIALQVQRDEQVNGRTLLAANGRVSLPIGRYFFSNAIVLQRDRGGGAESSTRINGTTDISGLLPSNWQLRASANYDISPEFKLRAALATLDHAVSEAVSLRLAGAHSFGRQSSTIVQGGATVRLPFADIAANASYGTREKEFRFGLQLAFGALFDTLERRYRLARPGVASGGNAAIRAYADRDGDGRFGPGDDPLSGVRIRSGGRPVETSPSGSALVTGLGDGARARIEIDLAGLDDPFLKAEGSVYSFVPRPGRVAALPVRFSPTGEVTLRLLFDDGGPKPRGLSALGVRLLAPDGSVAAEGRTEYDGALFLEGLKPGRYSVALDPEQSARLGFALGDEIEVSIAPGGGYAGEVQAVVRLGRPK